MGKLIELDVALDALREVIVPAEDIGFGDELTDGYNDGIDMAITVLSGLPTVDAVPVVRCAVCRYFRCNMRGNGTLPNGVCVLGRGGYDPMDFCSEGERKDGEQNG